jgi:WD40 repeat protein
VFTPDSQTLISAGSYPPLRLRRSILPGVSIVLDSIAPGGIDNAVRFWDVAGGKQRGTLSTGHEVGLFCLALSKNGRTLTAGGYGGTVWRWDLPAGKGGPPLLVSESARRYWDGTVKTLPYAPMFPVFHEHVAAVAVSPDGRLLATVSEDNADGPPLPERFNLDSDLWTIKLWDAIRGQELLTLPGKQRLVRSLAFSPDGQTLATNHSDAVHLWNTATGELRQSLAGHAGGTHCAVFSPDGSLLATGGGDWRVRLWDLCDGQILPSLLGHTDTVNSIAFSPDGRVLASGGRDGKLNLWSVGASQPVATLEGHTGGVCCVVFSPDGHTLASGGDSSGGIGEIHLWRAAR